MAAASGVVIPFTRPSPFPELPVPELDPTRTAPS